MVSEKALDDYETAARARVEELEVELDQISKELAGAQEALSHAEITRATLIAVAASQPQQAASSPAGGVVACGAPAAPLH